MTQILDQDKIQTQKQWDNDPCGASTVKNIPFGSLAYYRAIRQHRYEEYAPWMLDIMPFEEIKDKDVLEIGVGLGSDHYQFARHNSMTMLDLSQTHLNCTKQHMDLEGLKSKPTFGDAEAMPFHDNSFDFVYSFGVLHHTPHIEKAIAEIYRVLRPGGEACIGLYNLNSWSFWLSTILHNGILKGNLFTKGWKKNLSMIEYREEDTSATPLVNLYTRKKCHLLFRDFTNVHITTHHVLSSCFFGLNKIFPKEWFEKHLAFGGWYLILRCQKPSVVTG